MGSITGAAGGVIRDVFINEIPLIFRKEIYAMACVVGGITYWLCHVAGMSSTDVNWLAVRQFFLARILAVKYHICLPILKGSDEVEANENKSNYGRKLVYSSFTSSSPGSLWIDGFA